MAADRKRQSRADLSKLSDEEWLVVQQRQLREERTGQQEHRYLQPIEVSRIEWLRYQNWLPNVVDDLPEDQALLAWEIYRLKCEFSIF